ncbi:MAG: hypothetical protein WD512_17735 [Candidatus Paceibacterota bacterium]
MTVVVKCSHETLDMIDTMLREKLKKSESIESKFVVFLKNFKYELEMDNDIEKGFIRIYDSSKKMFFDEMPYPNLFEKIFIERGII